VDRPRVGISRCLLGDEVRYDGGHKRDALLIETLGRSVEWVPVCPEAEVGMGTPREPIHLVAAGDGVPSGTHRVRLVGVTTGHDWTQAMDRWQRERLRALAGESLSGYILKAESPSCGREQVRVQTSDGVQHTGRGLFAQALLDAMPDLPVEEDARLRDPEALERFLGRVFTYHRESCLRNHA
jgi:uncharacterized protein YbbK (DUF523 family)